MKAKDSFWQGVRGMSILSVVLIHCLRGYATDNTLSIFILITIRQVLNFAVAVFIFLAGYFVNVKIITSADFNYKQWLVKRGG